MAFKSEIDNPVMLVHADCTALVDELL